MEHVAIPTREGWSPRHADDGTDWVLEYDNGPQTHPVRMTRRRGFIHCTQGDLEFACFNAGTIGALDKAFVECERQGRL